MKKFGFLLIVLLAMLAAAGAAMKHKEWTDAELQALETSWEANDSEEELDSFERRHRLISEMHKNKKDTDDPSSLPPLPGSDRVMMFVEMLPEHSSSGKGWSSKDTEKLTKKWRSLLISGGVDVRLYNADDKVLIDLERRLLPDTKEFLFDQPETNFLTVDSMDLYRDGTKRPVKN
ncbi:hypothetical protein NSK_000633 [Nannochloropsis salina CCMP1776]|uniref:Mesoderm development candidate 2 n=1 Tax=Nannochloropsis salina CCMP1776 TaxID=1027361 RepID=A0A4D9DBA6_9STRA|nr:hypothetical protein NSK_000633 [Nannochloropsis salina CCMP1776]|eukprot:TFJ88284.1 hypothetical protein NSK_000633 [Nannochloropsis salina CCMP1776]